MENKEKTYFGWGFNFEYYRLYCYRLGLAEGNFKNFREFRKWFEEVSK